MAFKKGQSGNPAGRKPGSRNKSNKDIRAVLERFLSTNLNHGKLQELFEKLDPKDKVRMLGILLRYTVALPFNPEALTEEQLLQIIMHLRDEQKKDLVSRD